MHTIQLEISDDLAEKVAPYRDQLSKLLELGLREWQEHERQERLTLREDIHRVLAMAGNVVLPRPYTDEKPYVRHTPVPITGRPVSELVIEQRGSP